MPDQMITPPVPPEVLAQLEKDAPAVVETLAANGSNVAADEIGRAHV